MRPTTALILLAAATAAAPAQTAFHNLGALSTPFAVSDNGVVAGYSDDNGQYYTWTASGGITYIGGAHPIFGGGQPAISNDGTRIVGSNLNTNTGQYEMAIYDTTAGSWTNLGGIGAASGDSTSSGWGISGDGNHAVGLGWVNAGTAHAIQWDQGGATFDLGSTVAGSSSRANAADGDGSVVVGWQDDEFGYRQGAYWDNGVQNLIFDNDGFQVGEALAVSDDGRWVTGVSYSDATYRYDTQTGTFEYIDPVNTFPSSVLGGAISDDGKTIVGAARAFGPAVFGEGYIWREGEGTMLIGDYFASQGVQFDDGFRFFSPFGMSGDGKTFAGWGETANFEIVGWVVTIPAPSTAGLLGLGGLLAARRRR